MHDYEIMMVVDADMSIDESEKAISQLLALFKDAAKYRMSVIENDDLAYEIKGKKKAHRYILNFELEDKSVLAEFNRMVLLNKSVLRHLLINESKTRGFRSRKNPKKMMDLEIRQQKYKRYIENKKNPTFNAS